MQPTRTLLASVRRREQVVVGVAVQGVKGPFSVIARAAVCFGEDVEVGLSLDRADRQRKILQDGAVQLEVSGKGSVQEAIVSLETTARGGEAAVRWSGVRLTTGGRSWEIPINPPAADPQRFPPPVLPAMRPPIAGSRSTR